MKIKVTWDALDIMAGRMVKDKHGCKCSLVCFEQDHGAARWGILRFADYFVTGPTTIQALISALNSDGWLPEEIG